MEFRNGKRQVYAITHNPTGKSYIGSSKNAIERMKSHIWSLRRGAHPVEDMQTDYDLYGEDYTLSILDEIYSFDDREREYEWMEKLKSNIRGCGYNYKDKFKQRLVIRPGGVSMNEKEMKLLKLIRESDDPEKAIKIAINVIVDFLKENTT